MRETVTARHETLQLKPENQSTDNAPVSSLKSPKKNEISTVEDYQVLANTLRSSQRGPGSLQPGDLLRAGDNEDLPGLVVTGAGLK